MAEDHAASTWTGKGWSRRRRPPEVRFWEKVDKTGDCWTWTAFIDPATGYGRFGVAAGQVPTAHRWLYEQVNGPVPAGWHVDHLCRNRACVRPEHLEAVTHRENLLRGDTVIARSAGVTHCPQGHPYDEANTYRRPNGHRHCRQCTLARNRAAYRRRRDAAAQ